ncbi:hypothetical protein BaRGS_00023087, partial [Batillaria attramentaria]
MQAACQQFLWYTFAAIFDSCRSIADCQGRGDNPRLQQTARDNSCRLAPRTTGQGNPLAPQCKETDSHLAPQGKETHSQPAPQGKETHSHPAPQGKETHSHPAHGVRKPTRTPHYGVRKPTPTPHHRVRKPTRTPHDGVRKPTRTPHHRVRKPIRTPHNRVRKPIRTPHHRVRKPTRSPHHRVRKPTRTPHQRADEKQQAEDKTNNTLKNQRTETADGNVTHSQLLPAKTDDNETLSSDCEDSAAISSEGNSTVDSFNAEGTSIVTVSRRTTHTYFAHFEDSIQPDTGTTNKFQTFVSTGKGSHVSVLRDFAVQSKMTTGTAALNATRPWTPKDRNTNQSQWTMLHRLEFTSTVSGSESSETSTADDAVIRTSPLNGTSTEVHVEPHQTRFSTAGDVRNENKLSVSPQTTSRKADIPQTRTYIRNLTLSSINISACFRKEKPLNFYASEGFVSYNFNDVDNNQNSSDFFVAVRFCRLKFHVPDGLVVHVQDIKIQASRAYLHVHDDRGTCLAYFGVKDRLLTEQVVYSHGKSVHIMIESVKMGLFGYVQTPGWDGRSTYPDNTNIWLLIRFHKRTTVMVSFQAFDLDISNDFMAVDFNGSCPFNFSEHYQADAATPPQFLYNCENNSWSKFGMYVYFRSDCGNNGYFTGFRMLFSIHTPRALPEQLPDGKWNCSVPYWFTFQHHFRCDFRQDCVNGEDERECFYKNHTCGEGWVLLEGKCYLYVRDKQRLSWNDASAACHDRGGYLASLNTPDEYLAVMRFLAGRSDGDVYIGLQSPSPVLPPIYHTTPRWSDGTMAYYVIVANSQDRPFCAYFARFLANGVLEPSYVECWYKHTEYYLCELETAAVNTAKSDSEESGIVTTTPPFRMSESTVLYTECPAGHLTHNFLACDVQSACWSRDDPSVSCLAPLFTCTNGYERVHYTFVCDYRPDCSDASDEDFCVLPPCQVTEFSCGNKQ